MFIKHKLAVGQVTNTQRFLISDEDYRFPIRSIYQQHVKEEHVECTHLSKTANHNTRYINAFIKKNLIVDMTNVLMCSLIENDANFRTCPFCPCYKSENSH